MLAPILFFIGVFAQVPIWYSFPFCLVTLIVTANLWVFSRWRNTKGVRLGMSVKFKICGFRDAHEDRRMSTFWNLSWFAFWSKPSFLTIPVHHALQLHGPGWRRCALAAGVVPVLSCATRHFPYISAAERGWSPRSHPHPRLAGARSRCSYIS